MDKSIRAIIVFCLAAFICACEKEPVHVDRILLDTESITLVEEESYKLTATVLPADAVDKKIVWTSTNASIAKVSADGVILGVSPGSAVIKATSDDKDITAECKVTVLSRSVTGISIDPAEFSLNELEEKVLKVTITPENAKDKTLKWESSDPTVAAVSYGVVYGLTAGEAIITAYSADGDCNASCKVTVECPAKGVSFKDHNVTLNEGVSVQLEVTVYPERATNQILTWTSSDPSVASVSEDGIVTAKASGLVDIIVEPAQGGKSDKCTIAVVSEVITIEPSELDLMVENEFDLIVQPDGIAASGITWSSTAPAVASVDSKGHVVALKAGEAVICATTIHGGRHAFCSVKVRNKVDKIEVTPSETDIRLGTNGETLKYALYILNASGSGYTPMPSEDADKVKIKWSSKDTSVATVDEYGHVTPVGKGSTIIIASDGAVEGTCKVTVLKPVTDISVNPKVLEIYKGESGEFSVTLTPSDADDLSFVARIPSNYSTDVIRYEVKSDKVIINAIKYGSTRLNVIPSLPLGMEFDYCDIKVLLHVESVSINGGSQRYMVVKDKIKLTATVLPKEADQSVSWSSDAPDVATVDQEGNITAVAPGEARITVTTNDLAKTASCNIIVTEAVESVVLDKTEFTITEGDSETIVATAAPSTSDQHFNWNSSNTDVATVDSNGIVTAKAAGTATISATATTNMFKKASCTVTVISKNIPVTSLSVNPKEITLQVGGTQQIYATVEPSNATNRATKWSSNSSAVRVESGFVTAVSVGKALVICTSEDNPKATDICTVTVVPPPVAVVSIALSPTTLTLERGKSEKITATISPSDATDQTLEWSSNNTSVATVSDGGVVTAATQTGTAVITAKSKSDPDVKATCSVTVKANIVHVTGVSLSDSSIDLFIGQTKQLKATVTPSGADDKRLRWTVSQGGVASVDQDGNVYGNKEGSATVTVHTVDGDYSKTCRVNVTKNKVDYIWVSNPNGITIKEGESFVVSAKAIAVNVSADPSFPAMHWNASPTSGVVQLSTLDSYGKDCKITAVSSGKATVSVISNDDSSKKVSFPVTVLPAGASGGGSEGVGFDDWDF